MTTVFRLVDTTSLRSLPADELFPGMLPRTGVALLVGPSGTGKSFFALMLAASVATGSSIATDEDWGRPLQRGSTVYVAGEGVAGMRSRIYAHTQFFAERMQGSSLPITLFELGDARLGADHSLDLKGAVRKAHEDAQNALPVRLIVIDTLISTFRIRDENSNADMQSVLDQLRAYAARFDCLVLATVHPGKGRGARRQGVRGASATFNGADAVLSLAKLPDGRRRLSIAKLRDSDQQGRTMEFVIEPVGASAVMRPSARQNPDGDQPASAYARDLARVLANAWASSTRRLENFLGQIAPAATLAEIVQAYVRFDAERAVLTKREASRRDTLRKRIERCLPGLIEAAYIEERQHGATRYYVSCSAELPDDPRE